MEFLTRILKPISTRTRLNVRLNESSAWHCTQLIPNQEISLSAAGLVALADLTTVARRTALTGTSALVDALVLCPGMHRQHDAPQLNRGEYPACAAMTTDYVFRVENQATILYLQNVGRPGQLTCLTVENTTCQQSTLSQFLSQIYDFQGAPAIASLAYVGAVALTLTVFGRLILLDDEWGILVLVLFVLSRSVDVFVMRRRSKMGWKGEPEPGKQSDLIILVSQDRWIRMRGAVDDVKAITSGEWLREPTFLESTAVATATLLVYLNAALVGNMSLEGQQMLLVLLFGSAGFLGLANEYTDVLKMYGRTVKIDGTREAFNRRLFLTRKLIKETGRSEWAIRLGMAQPSDIESWKKDRSDQGSRKLRSSKGADELVIL